MAAVGVIEARRVIEGLARPEDRRAVVGACASDSGALLCGGGPIRVIGCERPPCAEIKGPALPVGSQGTAYAWVGFGKLRLVRGLRT